MTDDEPGPFQIQCPHCGEVVTSWHWSAANIPEDGQRGLVWCGCGRTGADSMGIKDRGRVLKRSAQNSA